MIDRQNFPALPEPLKGPQRAMLRRALYSAFSTYDELHRFTYEVLDVDLNRWTNALAGLDANISVLMTRMDEQGKVMELVTATRAERPNNPALRAVEESLALTFNPFADVQESPGVPTDKSRVGVENVIVASAGFASANEFLGRLGEAEFRVCTISYAVPGGARVYGTGFLIGDDLVMTNSHVVERARAPFVLSGVQITLAFDFRTPTSATESCTLVATDWLLASDPLQRADKGKGLDYAIVRLNSNMGQARIGAVSGAAARGFFRPVAHDPAMQEPLLILQHPYDPVAGTPAPMRLTIGFVNQSDGTEIRHTANTLPGSSGSPVFNSRCELIGLHHWGDYGFNVAKNMGAIRNDLAAKGLAHLFPH